MNKDLTTLFNNLKTAWNTLKNFLPNELKNDIQKIDSRFSNIQKELETDSKTDTDKLKKIAVTLNNIIYTLLQEVKKQNHLLVLSELFFNEVKKVTYLSVDEILYKLKCFRVKRFIVATQDTNLGWLHKKGIHYPDSVHVATALREKCDFLVTFNIKDFEPVGKLIRIVEPNALP